MPERYLVTGCAGFIASKVTNLLLQDGHAVLGVNSLNDAYDPRLKRWRLCGFQRGKTSASINSTSPIWPRWSPCSPPKTASRSRQWSTWRPAPASDPRWPTRGSTIRPTAWARSTCWKCAGDSGVGKFLLASTSSLYGRNSQPPYREDADTNRPLSPYAASKKAAETLTFAYHHLHGLDVSIPRYFTVYGPAGRPDMSIFRFVRRIFEGEPIVVFGDGSQTRDFTFVDDIARGTIAALRPLGYEAINFGGDRPVSLRDHRADRRVDREGAADRTSPRASGRRSRHLGRRLEGRPRPRLAANRFD